MVTSTEAFAQTPRRTCVCFLLCIAFLFCPANGQSVLHNATDSLDSWGDLYQEAGYFTRSGVWKGGLPRLHRSTSSEAHSCSRTHSEAGFCMRWVGGYVEREGPINQELCNCTSYDTFCQEWECRRTPDGEPCTQTALQCVQDRNTRITNCICDRSASYRNPICQEWSCQEWSIYGDEQSESYVCLHEDQSQNYCYRWRGNITSSSHIKSTVCDCFDRSERHCRLWICEERALRRCAALNRFMCNFGFALGVCGGVGMVFNLALLVVAVFIRNGRQERTIRAVGVYIIGFLVLMLPLLLGATLTGGVYGIGWVSLMWSIPILIFIVHLYWQAETWPSERCCC